ncbi:hypothetical protein TREMEDRAFT_67435 [Tremella mesenterica DSM 1558]|uniref:uncharacterized protein n=1 Tax=Tremella mesenterica (strain ATCC 24925 / CBS 8224 / DSM 1558 / NBRC 9311 / NRRL Y-6157 / RJB 2259-6 / UBC 559-6) TaxID=578456 RepID=UPI0003F4A5DE|nr:uncharacterized protein TREMEDRAFT_67435 [Tremella mesenterica DSM 1558]EIW73581.1 hypothetical protein TREMEDRAFT_67435 [Tremella mesenterica DSM 1558]
MKVVSLFDVRGKVVLITGGGRGVGEMIASGFVHNGAKVYISSRSITTCMETSKRLSEIPGGGKCFALPADLSKYEECVGLVEEIERREGVLHILINNSGATWGEEFDTYPDTAWTKLMTLNVQRVFTLCQKFRPLLEKTEGWSGRIINIGSINGINVPGLETYAYSTSKAALHMLSKHLAQRLGPKITVNALALGPFRSKMMAATLEAFEDDIAQNLPMKRIGKPEDVIAACLWLSGKGGEWVTGTIIPIDGGSLITSQAKL